MKKKLFIFAVALAALAACRESKGEITKKDRVVYTDAGGHYHIILDTIRGHEYIIAQSQYGFCIRHSEGCSCKRTYSPELMRHSQDQFNDFNW